MDNPFRVADRIRAEEIIICSAIKVNDIIFRGHRHCHCFAAMNDQLSWSSTREQIGKLNTEQGFITSKNRFVDRKDALQIAIKNNQVLDKDNVRGDQLYSEDLY